VLVLGPYEAGRVQCSFYKQGEEGRLSIPLVKKRDIRTESIDKVQLGAEYDREKASQTKKRREPATPEWPRRIQGEAVCSAKNKTCYNQTDEGEPGDLEAGPLHASAAADGGAQKQNENDARARGFLHLSTLDR
jgi:hypothetical protein